jgi:outer membrane immunogenic protein
MLRTALLTSTMLLTGATLSLAADLPSTKTPPAAPYVAAPLAATWTGFYLGLNVGASISSSSLVGVLDGAFLTSARVPQYVVVYGSGTKVSNSTTGLMGGLTAGYNFQTGSIVFGLEGDLNFQGVGRTVTTATPYPAPLAGTVTRTSKLSDNWFGTVRPRLGVAFGQALLYVTGGLAVGNETSRVFTTDTVYTWAGSSNNTRAGWTLGGGLEYMFNPNWTLKAEYLYVNLGTSTYALPASPANPIAAFTLKAKESDAFSIVRVGINYKFGAPAAGAVVAKY